jgi:hypothetical protein
VLVAIEAPPAVAAANQRYRVNFSSTTEHGAAGALGVRFTIRLLGLGPTGHPRRVTIEALDRTPSRSGAGDTLPSYSS